MHILETDACLDRKTYLWIFFCYLYEFLFGIVVIYYSCMSLLFSILPLLIFPVGDTPLAYAVRSGTLDIVQYLLDHDANPDKPNGKGSTALHLAAAGGLSLCNLSFFVRVHDTVS